eukprot:TRINITY_DN1712_c0_g1_i2.p1 TRINITY_DN1712_c0_g1~~TRINITY_DN1712_c0_g1_i2.p1  ORF type:complete len:521 (-),score=138.47 TRINITY_DN1712_c0_g1_i2:132-1694(-)
MLNNKQEGMMMDPMNQLDDLLDEFDDLMEEVDEEEEMERMSMSKLDGEYLEDEIDQLLTRVSLEDQNNKRTTGVQKPNPMVMPIKTGISSGPGLKKGISTGPGIKTGISTGPGIKTGISTGPGVKTGISSGPGLIKKSPNDVITTGVQNRQNLGPVGRGRPLNTTTPLGEQVIHTGPDCAKCGEKIIGQVAYAGEKPFHKECLRCSECFKILAGKQFTRKDDKILCLEDYYNLYSPKCYICKNSIKNECVNVKQKEGIPSRVYHPEHFLCVCCGNKLTGSPYKVDVEGDPFCLKCFGKRLIVKPPPENSCKFCKRLIVGEFILLNGQYIHPEHYECKTCQKPFFGGDSHEYEGYLYCYEHYLMMFKKICAACRKPINGRSLTAMGRQWHPEHFVCTHCHTAFGETGFWEKGGDPYCQYHYFELFGQMCQKCGEPGVTDIIKAFGRVWHKEHFECQGCSENIANRRNIYNFQDKPLCYKCFKRLPKDVREELKKRRRGAREALRRRKKLDKEEQKNNENNK